MNRMGITVIVAISILISPCIGEAKSLFHATSKAAARKIAQQGFSARMMSPKARFGKGVYLAESKKLALKEKPHAATVMRFKDSKLLKKRPLDVRKMSTRDLKAFSHDRDLRGNIHKGVPGGDLAKKLGREAGKQGKAITYPSAKGGGANTFIPKSLYEQHPGIVRHR